MILPATFDSNGQYRVSRTALGCFSIALLVVGFAIDAVACLICRDRHFRIDCVLLPGLVSCILGLLTVLYSFIVSSRYVWNTTALIVTLGSAISAAVYATLLILACRKMAATRKHGHRFTPLVAARPSLSSPSTYHTSASSTYHASSFFENHVANTYPASLTTTSQAHLSPSIPPHELELTEEDLMRQQMLMLLADKSEFQTSPGPASSDSFNRIDFSPTDDFDATRNPRLSLLADNQRHPATSLSRQSSQQSWRRMDDSHFQPWDGVWRHGGLPRVVTREQRRQEIEQGH